MVKWTLVFSLALLTLFAGVPIVLSQESSAAGPLNTERVTVASLQERILASTIQMLLITSDHNCGEADLNRIQGKRGLGSVVSQGAQRLILTHDHWGFTASNLIGVELCNCKGERLLLLDGPAFLSLIRYRDGGTLILQAPQQLSGVIPARLGNGANAAPGDRVWLVARRPDGGHVTRVVGARVEGVDVEASPERLLLRAPQEAGIAIGDSGGGVWLKGRVVGNLWSIVADPRSQAGQDGSRARLSNLVFAAVHRLSEPAPGWSDYLASEPIRRMQATRAASVGWLDSANSGDRRGSPGRLRLRAGGWLW